MEFIKGFFKEGEQPSMMRLCCFICVITACILAVYKQDSLLIISTLLGFGIGGKAVQKFKEN